MSKYFVVSGYCGPDNYTSDNGPILEVTEYDTAEQVEKAYRDFMEETEQHKGSTYASEYSDVTFRVFRGEELKIHPVETVVKYKLQE